MNNKKKFLYIASLPHAGLPKGFTELEYLESNGTQYIDLDITVDDKTTLRGFVIADMTRNNYNLFGIQEPQYRMILNSGKEIRLYINTSTYPIPTPDNGEVHFDLSPGRISVNGSTQSTVLYQGSSDISLFRAYGSVLYKGHAKFYNFEVESEGVTVLSLIPVLNAGGVPGMYDKVSKSFFRNDGTGTFGYRIKGADNAVAPLSLRDPYYVAPSGVYARLVAENDLDIIADTDIETDVAEQYGYTWFDNTAEAYEHFGVVLDAEQMTV